MNISYRWLQSLIPGLTSPPAEVAARLAMYGAPVDEITLIGEQLREVIIARVVEAKPHPNSDHLSVCKVDAGTGELLNVVCGAPNVRADAFYPFAPVGTTLPGGLELSKRKIRGEESNGMLCSARELELGRDHEGILELVGPFTPGESFVRAVDLDDARIVIDVTPNRGDLLSHLGVARELSATGVNGIGLPPFPGAQPSGGKLTTVSNDGEVGGVKLRIDDADACPRYLVSVVRGVRVGPSPEWLAMRLRAIGQRPINNIVDATNYVLHELGQPLHAFDLNQLGGSAIIVRRARAGEKLVTLDGIERALQPLMLVIADAEKPTAIAGVMGGQLSEVGEGTTDVLIECAHFERKQIRDTRRALGMSTDASYRFERGVDPTGMERALRRVRDLICATAGGRAEPNLLDVAPKALTAPTIEVRLARVEQVLGESFSADSASALLEAIGFEVYERGKNSINVRIPGHRWFDVAEEIDLIEEIARRHGYDTFPGELRPFRPSVVPDHPLSILEDDLRTRLAGWGLLEARTAGFAPEAEGDVALLLPLSSAESRLRRAVLPSLVHRVEYNFTRGNRDVRLFEIATAFGAAGPDGAPNETTRLAIVLTGARAPVHWSGAADDYTIWDLKGLAEELAPLLGFEVRIPKPATATATATAAAAATAAPLDPTALFELVDASDKVVGFCGQISPTRVDAPAWAGSILGLEVTLRTGSAHRHAAYIALPQFPAIEQDIALVVPRTVAAAQVAETIRASGGAFLERVTVFDLYEGKGVPESMRSIAYRLRFRAGDRTLTDADASTAVGRILKRLKDEHGIERR